MALQKFYIGTHGPYYYDDTDDVADPDGDFTGDTREALTTSGQLNVETAPTLDGHVIRKVDVDGYVTGPASATDNAITRFDGVTGKLIQNSSLLLNDSGDLSKTNSDLLLTCGPNKTLELQNIVYDDLQVSISNIKIPPANAPKERFYNHGIVGGVTFPVLGFALNEYIYFDLQTYHSMKLNTILDNHIHFMTPTDGSSTPDRFKFQLDVIAAGIGGSWAVPAGSPFTAEHIITADYTNKHQIQDIADIPAVNTTVSSIYSCKLTRIAATQDEYSEEVYLKFTDCHYQKNTLGSRQEGVK